MSSRPALAGRDCRPTSADRLQESLTTLVNEPRVGALPLPELVRSALPVPWVLVAHRVRFFADVVVLRRGGSAVWGVMSIPTPVRGRPSTWADTPPVPVPYADLPAEKTRVSLTEAVPAWVGTLTDIVAPWLSHQEEPTEGEPLDPVASGHLTIIDVLLEVSPAEDRRSLERLLADREVAVPLTVPAWPGHA